MILLYAASPLSPSGNNTATTTTTTTTTTAQREKQQQQPQKWGCTYLARNSWSFLHCWMLHSSLQRLLLLSVTVRAPIREVVRSSTPFAESDQVPCPPFKIQFSLLIPTGSIAASHHYYANIRSIIPR